MMHGQRRDIEARAAATDWGIVTPRLTLRPLHWRDADAIAEAVGNLAVSRWLSVVPHPYTRADAVTFLDRQIESQRAGESLALGLVDGSGLIGVVGLKSLATWPELGYWLAERSWRQGLMGEAVTAFVARAFSNLPIERMHSGVFEGNAASLRIQERLGFDVIGHDRLGCLARGCDLPHIRTVLTRARHEEFTR